MEWLKIIGFGEPWVLWGLIACSIPVLLNFLNRRRYQVLPWGAMQFLQRALEKNRRRLQMENLLLLLVRMAIIAFLVLAFSEPYLRSSQSIFANVLPTRTHTILVLDNSYSMARRVENRELWHRAKELARKLIEESQTGDTVALLALNETCEVISAPRILDGEGKTQQALLAILGELSLSHYTTDYTALFAPVQQLLNKLERMPLAQEGDYLTRVVLITDGQRRGWQREDEWKKGIEKLRKKHVLFEVHPLTSSANNVAVTAFRLEREDTWEKLPFRFVVQVKNFGEVDVQQAFAEIQIVSAEAFFRGTGTLEGPKTRISFKLLAGEQKSLLFPAAVVEKAGVYLARLRIGALRPSEADLLEKDNERYLTFEVRPPAPLLFVDGERKQLWETDFLRLALAPYSLERSPRPSAYAPVVRRRPPEKDWQRFDAIVLANYSSLTLQEVRKLEAFVAEGGGLVVFLGSHFEKSFVWERYNQLLYKKGKGLLPGRIEWRERPTYANLVPRTYEHPIFRFFLGYKDRLSEPQFWKYADIAPSEDARVLAHFSDEGSTPAVLEKVFGRGKVILLNMSADRDWTNFPVTQGYLIFMQELFRYILRPKVGALGYLVGDPVPLTLFEKLEVDVITPEGDRLTNPVLGKEGQLYLSEEVVQKAGFYALVWRIGAKERARQYLALNLRTHEGDLESVSTAEWEKLIPKEMLELHRETEASGQGSPKLLAATSRRGRLWYYCLLIAMALIFWESWLAYRFGSHSR